ncbi:hypothetical protein VO64_0196 [Pseudomonas synxantha]|uniref:Uncharacterized protein n=1 Tax=Pseudomonas synxantha TaxID=47883 RepID=A0AAU8TS20_9PSED|nr:hypothetical protein VO64_0196 [Pseudomonas synxantha]
MYSRFAYCSGTSIDEDMLAGSQLGLVYKPVPGSYTWGAQAGSVLE